MKKWTVEEVYGYKPVNRIMISGTMILDVDLNDGWEITNVEFNDMVPANHLDELIVTFAKKKGEDKSEI